MKEQYQPSQDEIKKAEDMMTHKQKEMSRKRKYNFEFVNEFNSFGIDDQEMIDKLMQYGKISNIQTIDDVLEVIYKTGKYKKIIVRKSEVKKIDPKTDKVIDTQMHFKIDLHPESSRYEEMSPKYSEYPSYNDKDAVDLTEEVLKGRIIED